MYSQSDGRQCPSACTKLPKLYDVLDMMDYRINMGMANKHLRDKFHFLQQTVWCFPFAAALTGSGHLHRTHFSTCSEAIGARTCKQIAVNALCG